MGWKISEKNIVNINKNFKMKEEKLCVNCVMDTTDSKIIFDEKGVCDHCNTFYSDILPKWHTDERGNRALKKIVKKIKKTRKR